MLWPTDTLQDFALAGLLAGAIRDHPRAESARCADLHMTGQLEHVTALRTTLIQQVLARASTVPRAENHIAAIEETNKPTGISTVARDTATAMLEDLRRTQKHTHN